MSPAAARRCAALARHLAPVIGEEVADVNHGRTLAASSVDGAKDAGSLSYERAMAAFRNPDSGAFQFQDRRKEGGLRIAYRAIEFYEFDEKLADIERSDFGTGFYELVDGRLAFKPAEREGWDRQRRWIILDRVRACMQRGGAIIGAFDVQKTGHQVLVGAVVLDGQWMGKGMDTLDVSFLFVASKLPERYLTQGGKQKDFRNAGIEDTLWSKIVAEAKARGARKLYISAAANLGGIIKLPGMTQPLAPSAYL
uniref:Uncharacterized protein n=1 Tax=Alexandrium catenella TaxID=2925 RepID=A0A7S1SAV3_ALECA